MIDHNMALNEGNVRVIKALLDWTILETWDRRSSEHCKSLRDRLGAQLSAHNRT